MSWRPSLSQSKKPTPPLMDSRMYFLSGEEMCGTVRPACAAISSNTGGGGKGGSADLFCAVGFAGGGAGRETPRPRKGSIAHAKAQMAKALAALPNGIEHLYISG